MTQFLAILRDSFREAVDGFVIYAMLGLSALAILIVGSMSFEPAPAERAFDKVVNRFNAIFPDKGRSRYVSGGSSSEYKVSDVAPAGGGHHFRLTVTAQPNSRVHHDGKAGPDPDRGDSFRAAVAQWAGQTGQTVSVKKDGKKFEGSMPTRSTDDEQRAVTTEQMEEFLANQFALHAGMTATAKRAADGAAEPVYAFDVTTAGGSGVRGWPHKVSIFFGAVDVADDAPLGIFLWGIEDQVINGLGAGVALLISVILTAFYVPNMLRKGSVDLLISKPIGRTRLLVYKYVGGLIFIFLVSAFTVGGMWVVLGLRSGYWDPTFLILIPVLTFTFAVLYSVSVLLGVLTRSPIVAMLGTIAFMFLLWLAGTGKNWLDTRRNEDRLGNTPQWLITLIDTANTVLPRYKDLDTITSKLLGAGTLTPAEERMVGLGSINYPDWTTTIGTCVAFIAVMLTLACWRFRKRDS